MSGELPHASVYVSLLPVVEACVVVVVPGHVGEVRVTADEPEAVDLDPGARKCAVRTLLAPQYARIKMDGIRLVGGNPDFTNAPGHGDDDARIYDRQQAYVHAHGG